MKKILKVINKSNNELPNYETLGSAGMDLKAYFEEDIIIKPMQRLLIPTGLFIEIPIGYEGQIRPRSGLAIKHGLSLINCVGTIDSDYRGEIKIPMINLGDENFVIKNGERIAQFILSSYEIVQWKTEEKLTDTNRGNGGFGSTGK